MPDLSHSRSPPGSSLAVVLLTCWEIKTLCSSFGARGAIELLPFSPGMLQMVSFHFNSALVGSVAALFRTCGRWFHSFGGAEVEGDGGKDSWE